MRSFPISLVVVFACCTSAGADDTVADFQRSQLTIVDPASPQIREFALTQWPADNVVHLVGPLPSFVKVWLSSDPDQTPLEYRFN